MDAPQPQKRSRNVPKPDKPPKRQLTEFSDLCANKTPSPKQTPPDKMTAEVATRAIQRQLETLREEISETDRKRIEITQKLRKLREKAATLEQEYNALRTNESSQFDWTKREYAWTARIKQALRDTFGLDAFRPQQLAAVNAALAKQDLVVVMATGGGKSLCYQLPTLVTGGVTLVVSPLLSLIEDQIISLKKVGIEAVTINSGNNRAMGRVVTQALVHGSDVRVVFVTPEWVAKSKRFMANLQKCYAGNRLDRVVIDEVHCCSQWGHDFRRDYQNLHIFKSAFPSVPVMGLTATATDKILWDAQQMLGVPGCLVLRTPCHRSNLYYEVRAKPPTEQRCLDVLQQLLQERFPEQSGIIYAGTVNECGQLTEQLRERGLRVSCYHSSLDPEARLKVHTRWLSGRYQAVVATSAFGMGIDKPDVRFVIHHTMPRSLESFYQESGRAGRDSRRSDCIILYSLRDVSRLSGLVSSSSRRGAANLYNTVAFCLDTDTCRHSLLAAHFQEPSGSSCGNMCDSCAAPVQTTEVDIKGYARRLFAIMDEAEACEERLTALKLLGAWLRVESGVHRDFAERVVAHLLVQGFLAEEMHFTPYATLMYIRRGPKSQEEQDITLKVPKSELNLKRKRDSTEPQPTTKTTKPQ